ncbi:hypothetical protein [Faecalibacterium sp. An122]|uniref:hypothetical protein n=1 Tax=Faecalibacterium sp. An122 TaxID=1965551 RepID=UPI000B3A6170|nr:hypothetical protein [Faecalibacterium sp. An122]OUQ35624.1 hypothetical protein B5E67_11550 [Faecalibacterium sp. An122]
MGYGSINVGYPVEINQPGGVAGIGSDGKIPAQLIPEMGGGFVQMTEEIPVENRQANTLYSLIEVDFGTGK